MIGGASDQPEVVAAIAKILEMGAVDDGSLLVIYCQYTSETPPHVELLRLPMLFDLLVRELFTPGIARVFSTDFCTRGVPFGSPVCSLKALARV